MGSHSLCSFRTSFAHQAHGFSSLIVSCLRNLSADVAATRVGGSGGCRFANAARRAPARAASRAVSLRGSSAERLGRECARRLGLAVRERDVREADQRAGVGLLLADRHPLAPGRAQEAAAQIHLGEQLAALTLRQPASACRSGSSDSKFSKSWTRSSDSSISASSASAGDRRRAADVAALRRQPAGEQIRSARAGRRARRARAPPRRPPRSRTSKRANSSLRDDDHGAPRSSGNVLGLRRGLRVAALVHAATRPAPRVRPSCAAASRCTLRNCGSATCRVPLLEQRRAQHEASGSRELRARPCSTCATTVSGSSPDCSSAVAYG